MSGRVLTEADLERLDTMDTAESPLPAIIRELKHSLRVARMELSEWQAGAMADAKGHMLRCAKVNGVWNCAKGCAVNDLRVARAALKGLALSDGPTGNEYSWCDDGWLCEHAECIAARAALGEQP